MDNVDVLQWNQCLNKNKKNVSFLLLEVINYLESIHLHLISHSILTVIIIKTVGALISQHSCLVIQIRITML